MNKIIYYIGILFPAHEKRL